jgi:hypothetical protein
MSTVEIHETRVGAVDPHRGGADCPACVTCACGIDYPSKGGGRCLTCGGVSASAAARHGEPHVGRSVSECDRPAIRRLIASFMSRTPPESTVEIHDEVSTGAHSTIRETALAGLQRLREEALKSGFDQIALDLDGLIRHVDGTPAEERPPLPYELTRMARIAEYETRDHEDIPRRAAILREAIALLIPPRPDFGHGPAGGSAYEHGQQAAWDRDYGHLPGADKAGTRTLLGQVFDRAPATKPEPDLCPALHPIPARGAECAQCVVVLATPAPPRAVDEGEAVAREIDALAADPEFQREIQAARARRDAATPRAVADLTDDEIVNAIARLGLDGLPAIGEDDDDFDEDDADFLAGRLGLPDDDYEISKALIARTSALHKAGRLRSTATYGTALSTGEWGRRIAARLGCPARADEIAAVLKGEEG